MGNQAPLLHRINTFRKKSPVKRLKDNTTSVYDALTMARFMKIYLNKGSWQLCNTRAKDLERMKKMGFVPDERIVV